MSEGIASRPPLGAKYVTVQHHAAFEPSNTWTLAAVSGGVLLLYSLSRIIALQRRVRDLEARPPVDDIVMRGMIRQQVSEMVSDLEQSIRARNAIKPALPLATTASTAAAAAVVEKTLPAAIAVEKTLPAAIAVEKTLPAAVAVEKTLPAALAVALLPAPLVAPEEPLKTPVLEASELKEPEVLVVETATQLKQPKKLIKKKAT